MELSMVAFGARGLAVASIGRSDVAVKIAPGRSWRPGAFHLLLDVGR